MKQISVTKRNGKVFIVVGDPDARDNSNQKISVSESEAAMLLMKLKGVFQ